MASHPYELNWKKLDPEARLGFAARRFTGVGNLSSALLGLLFTGVFYLLLYPLWQMNRWQMVNMFFHGGPENRSTIPYYTMFLTMWSLAFLLIKWRKLVIQKRALRIRLLPDDPDYILSPQNSAELIRHLNRRVYMAEGFLVHNRILKALANLKNIGRVADVSSVLKDLAAADEKYTEGTYTLPRGLIWAIPVTGFIGTVLGLSQAIGGFGAVIARGADFSELKSSLGGVTGGLAVAFETTLIALVAALIVQLLLTILVQKEEAFLDECSSYCYRNIVSRLRLIDIREELES